MLLKLSELPVAFAQIKQEPLPWIKWQQLTSGTAESFARPKTDKKKDPTSFTIMTPVTLDSELYKKLLSLDQLLTSTWPVLLTRRWLSESDKIFLLKKSKRKSGNWKWSGMKKSRLCSILKCPLLAMLHNRASSNFSNLLEISIKSDLNSL